MRIRHLRTVLLALLICHGPALAQAVPKAWAYLGWWLPDSWRDAPPVDRLLFFELKVDGNGRISERNGWPERWTELRMAVKERGTALDLTLTLFDAAAFDQLFSSAPARASLLDEATTLSRAEGVAGLQLDFEIYTRISPAVLEHYQLFVRELALRLRQQNPPRNLSVFFPVGGESVLYDATTLAQLDQVVLQGYDAHWRGSPTAGPVAPLFGEGRLTWEKAVTQGLFLGVDKERLLLGYPLYGYEWPVKSGKIRGSTTGSGVSTSFAPLPQGQVPEIPISIRDRVNQYGATHDPASGSSYYQLTSANGQLIEGWFEDWWSLARKSDYLVREQLGGLAFFMLGYDQHELINYFLKRRQAR